jgi:uncharacterized membrane protein (DUF106 family)
VVLFRRLIMGDFLNLVFVVVAALVGLGIYGSIKKGIDSKKVADIKKQTEEANAEVSAATAEADQKRKEADSARDTDSNTIALDKFNKRFGG